MECSNVCLELVGYIRNELTPSLRQAMELHLQECPCCLAELRSMHQTLDLLKRELTPLEVPMSSRLALVDMVRERIRATDRATEVPG